MKVLQATIVVSLFLLIGCTQLNKEVDKSNEINVEKDDAEKLDVHLEIGYGIVDISSGADNWASGIIDYNYADLEPKVTYKLRRDKGNLTIDQPKTRKLKVKKGNINNRWDIALSNDIPIDLKVETGASETKMKLAGMKLSQLDVEVGVGSTTLDLSGTWEESFAVNLEMGIGESTIILPKDVGVKVKSETGIAVANMIGLISVGDGVYVNEVFEDADVIITVDAELGLGETSFIVEE